jgi:hypothetical protein
MVNIGAIKNTRNLLPKCNWVKIAKINHPNYKIKNYATSLKDYVFWESSEFYLKSMQKYFDE